MLFNPLTLLIDTIQLTDIFIIFHNLPALIISSQLPRLKSKWKIGLCRNTWRIHGTDNQDIATRHGRLLHLCNERWNGFRLKKHHYYSTVDKVILACNAGIRVEIAALYLHMINLLGLHNLS